MTWKAKEDCFSVAEWVLFDIISRLSLEFQGFLLHGHSYRLLRMVEPSGLVAIDSGCFQRYYDVPWFVPLDHSSSLLCKQKSAMQADSVLYRTSTSISLIVFCPISVI